MEFMKPTNRAAHVINFTGNAALVAAGGFGLGVGCRF